MNAVKIKKINETLFKGDRVIPNNYVPKMKWKGSKISIHMLEEIKAFLQWAHKELKVEAMVKLFFNHKEQEWLVFVPFQENSGASCQEVPNGKNKEAREIEIPADYMLMGSIHSHCDMSAFASGTDEADETNIPGIHITFGNMNSVVWSIHKRVSFGKHFYNAEITNWFDIPKWKGMDDRMKDLVINLSPNPLMSFNEKWKERIIVKKPMSEQKFFDFDYKCYTDDSRFGMTQKQTTLDLLKSDYGTAEKISDVRLPWKEAIDNAYEIDDNVILKSLQILIRTYGIHMQEIINMEVTGNNPIFEDDMYVDKYDKNRNIILQFVYLIAQENDLSMEELFHE